MLLVLGLALSPAFATDVDGVVGDLSYGGNLGEDTASYTSGKPVSISHSGGNISVNCLEAQKLSARLPYNLSGSAESSLEAYGNGIGLKVGGDGKGGGVVSTRMPTKTSGVATVDAPLTVNVPVGASAITVSQSGSGWVSVKNCSGALKVSAGAGGVFASGSFTSVTVSATGGDVKVVVSDGGVLKGTSSVSAPGGNAALVLSTAQGGKLSAKGSEVSVQQTVMGTNDAGYVSGTFGVSGPSISVSAKQRVDVTAE